MTKTSHDHPTDAHPATVRAIIFRALSPDASATNVHDRGLTGHDQETLVWSLDSSQYTSFELEARVLRDCLQEGARSGGSATGTLVDDKNAIHPVSTRYGVITLGNMTGVYGVALTTKTATIQGKLPASTEHLISIALASARYLADQCLLAQRLAQFGHDNDITSTNISGREEVVEHIVRCYEAHLKYTPQTDRWFNSGPAGGRNMFARQVAFYVQRDLPLVAVLPAFPCKSSNLDKVSGVLPDKGEELALRTLKLFIDTVREIYPPGITVVIVSDGHVFSDLVCTDDHTVDLYNKHLKLMAGTILAPNEVTFAGLDDLLDRPANTPLSLEGRSEPIGKGVIVTKKTHEAEMGRMWLMDMFGKDGELDARLAANPALMGLCRGFSRFVLEDTAQHPGVRRLSLNQRRKAAWDTAKWMIQRNEAYSSLVQARFPAAIRFSIHPHDNSGPKFAISLLHPSFRPPGEVGAAGSSAAGVNFHIPTPWHNVVLELPYGGYVFVKRRVLTQLAASDHEVMLVRADEDAVGQGMFYRLAV